ncbi:MAG: NPCBM/NEW2 domain-containing protein [Planctomycetota bacterium]
MACLLWMMWALLGDLPQVQVETLKTGPTAGELKQMTPSQIVVGERQVPLAEVLEIRFPPPATPSTAAANPIEVMLSDGSRLTGSQITLSGTDSKLTSAELGNVSIRKNVIRSIRFTANDTKLDDSWQKILDRNSKKDVIVVRKDDKLDFLAGVAGSIDDQVVKFLVDGEEVPVKRERVYGLIYQPPAATGKPQSIIELQGDVTLQTKQIVSKDQGYQVILASGVTLTVPSGQIRTIDFSLGKVRQLSSLKPSDVQYVSFWGPSWIWEYRKDVGPLSGPISLGGLSYEKGLSIHSKTKLTYRLQGDYRLFQTVLGIDDMSDDNGTLGDVKLTISADGKPLLEADVKGTDAPRKVDLNVTGVRELQILVDFGGDLDIADWLSLGDAKLTK